MGVFEPIAQLVEPTEMDDQDQQVIREWRLRALKSNAEALGRDYLASLIDLSEIQGLSGIEQPLVPRYLGVARP